MILKTKIPGRVVQRRVRKPGGGYRIKPWFKFDENGLKELDESKLTQADIVKLKRLFEVVENTKAFKDMKYQELQIAYAEKTGHSAVGMKKKDLLKELEG